MKKILVAILAVLMLATFVGCANYDLLDTNYQYDEAIIELHDGNVIKVAIKSWRDYEGEQIQITAKDGTVYLTNSYNCTLIRY